LLVKDREGLVSLESCLGRPISKKSVLEGLSIRRRRHPRIDFSYSVLKKRNIFQKFRGEGNEQLSVISIKMVMNT